MTTYRLRIYSLDARTIERQSTHSSYRSARRSVYDYERRHGRRPHVIDHEIVAGAR